MKKFDVAVIGGGLAGLTTAVFLGKAGKSVVLLEKANVLGGRAITVNKNGVKLNLGPHAIFKGGEAYAIHKELGITLQGGSPTNQGGFALWHNKLHPLPLGPITILTSKLLTLAGKLEFGRFMIKLGRINATAIPNISLRDWAENVIKDPMVRHIFYAICRTSTYASDPDNQYASLTLKQVQRALKDNVLYVDGGWEIIVTGLREQAINAGVTLLNHKHVTTIEHDDKVRELLFSDGEKLEVPTVVVTMGPEEACKLVKDAASTSLRQWADQIVPIKGVCLDLGLRRLPNAANNFAFGLDQPVFYTNQSRAAKLSDDGTIVVHLIKYAGKESGDPKSTEKELEQTMDILQPQWRKEVVARQFLPHMTTTYTQTIPGASGPGPAVPQVKGLYVAGDWAGHGEMLADAAMASGKRAAQAILMAKV